MSDLSYKGASSKPFMTISLWNGYFQPWTTFQNFYFRVSNLTTLTTGLYIKLKLNTNANALSIGGIPTSNKQDFFNKTEKSIQIR